jgi:mono/diheme cytochrome c family protein
MLIVVLARYGATRASISSLPEPGRFETLLATKVKNWFLSRAARGPLPPAPPNDTSNVAAGGVLFGMACASCHGQDGRAPTPIGKSMYPPVLDLGSREVQGLSDRELFWVIKNGIRLSGMPDFARINRDEQIWQ